MPFVSKGQQGAKDLHQNKAMKKLTLIAGLAASAIGARVGELRQSAPNN